jgi:glycosyltransferase involved in cell wall biosynthesis
VKVLFISRSTLFEDVGGDTVQLKNTAENLRELGVEVDIWISKEKVDYARYDLLHFFNIIRPADILPHTKSSKRPYVVSTIYVDYSEFEKQQRRGLAGFIFRMLAPDLIEYSKTIARSVINGEKIKSLSYILVGQRGSIKKIIKQAKCLLPNSDCEYKRLVSHYGVKQKYKVIPNAIDPVFFVGNEKRNKDSNMVLCVARIEGRKNQLNLIKALNNSVFHLIIVGAPAANQASYFKECKEAGSTNVEFVNHLSQEKLLDYYKKARVHVLPSWFETTGLSSLEAAVMGCNIVITDKGDTREYFEDMAYYCDPASPESIRTAVEAAANSPFNEKLREKILREYTWDITAKKTLEAYRQVLDKRL